MEKYQAVIILHKNADFEIIKINLKNILNYIENMNDIGIKRFAYDIKGESEGRYIEIKFRGSSEVYKSLEKYCRQEDDILKFIIVREDY